VPGYLVATAGLRDLSLSSFTLPIEEGSEPSASAVSAMTALAAKHRIKVLFYNNQAVSPITQRVRAAAKSAGVPVIGVAETVPAGLTFQAWQLKQARELLAALGG
jgi:zinc/manganese transport system substrate-binding protein